MENWYGLTVFAIDYTEKRLISEGAMGGTGAIWPFGACRSECQEVYH